MSVLAISVTEQGRAMAARLPYERVHGQAAATIRSRWPDPGLQGLVLFLAVGAAVRIIGPLLGGKERDPAVVCVDEAGRWVIPVLGGHGAGANALARDVAALLGAEAVVTTATDATGIPALDSLPGLAAEGDVAGVTAALLDGLGVAVTNELGWPLPEALVGRAACPAGNGTGGGEIVVTDRQVAVRNRQVLLRPPSLVVGVGTSTGAPPSQVQALVRDTLASAGLAAASVGEVATIDRRGREPAVLSLGWPVRTFDAAQLAGVTVPNPSVTVAGAVGTPSVAEAAALLAGGAGAELVVSKRKNAVATVAVARRRQPRGRLSVVGLGPGAVAHRTPAAAAAVRAAEVVIGYGPYLDAAADLHQAHQELVRSPIGDEVVRAKQALAEAGAGRRVAMVCSGDPGVYAMASIILELAGEEAADVDIEVVPGVTAALAAAASLGAPLGHDHVAISLSDLLTPWPVIETRLRAAAETDLVVALYNPRSRQRDWQLDAARQILLAHRPGATPVGVVTDATRPGQRVELTTLAELDTAGVGMTTCVLVGSSTTRLVAGRMVTPRGYQP